MRPSPTFLPEIVNTLAAERPDLAFVEADDAEGDTAPPPAGDSDIQRTTIVFAPGLCGRAIQLSVFPGEGNDPFDAAASVLETLRGVRILAGTEKTRREIAITSLGLVGIPQTDPSAGATGVIIGARLVIITDLVAEDAPEAMPADAA